MKSRIWFKRMFVGLLVLSTSVAAQDSVSPADAFYAAIRANDLPKLEAMLKSGGDPNVADPRGGATPLMYAATVGSTDAMKLLLDRGANVNATSSSGATALMWAANDIDKVRLLLDRGADAKLVSQGGRTALFLAARTDPSVETVTRLIAAGANVKAVDKARMTVLHAAAVGNDTATIRLLLEAGLDPNVVDFAGFTPLIHAAANRNVEAVRMLIAKGADVNAQSGDGSFQKVKAGSIALGNWTPLTSAASQGPHALIQALLDAGARVDVPDVRGMTPLMLAVANDRQDLKTIRLLLAKGADVNAKSRAGETALDWALKIGSKAAIETLRSAGAKETSHEAVAVPAPAHATLQTSVERSLTLLKNASAVAAANGGCASCHSHNVIDIAENVARRKGVEIEKKVLAQRQTLTKAPYFSPANLFERLDPPGSPITTVFALFALANSGYEPDRSTDAAVVHLMSQQSSDGRWFMGAISRPPIGEGHIAITALGIHALKAYATPGHSAAAKKRIDLAASWLAAQKAVTTEDRNMQLLGLHWAGRDVRERARLVKAILANQRRDGGWGQTEHLSSDAYATGVSLVALAQAGGITPDHAAYKKGVAYLLSTQRPDGSWYVKSRAVKFQPFFDGGFPYGHDQWISSMATGWAAAALATALPGN